MFGLTRTADDSDGICWTCFSAGFSEFEGIVSRRTVPKILFVGPDLVTIVLVIIELCRPHSAEGRLVALLEIVVPSHQNKPLCVSLSSFDRCRNFAIHVDVYVSLADYIPCILCRFPQYKGDAAAVENSNDVACSCPARRHANYTFFSDHQSASFLAHSIVEP